MRPWRKVYASILSSDSVSDLSDQAYALFILLIIAQDDAGAYPWTPSKVKALTLTRRWSHEQATEYRDELINAGLAHQQGNLIVLTKGEQFNGIPSWVRTRGFDPLFYNSNDNVITPSLQRNDSVTTEQLQSDDSVITGTNEENPTHVITDSLQGNDNVITESSQEKVKRRVEKSREGTSPSETSEVKPRSSKNGSEDKLALANYARPPTSLAGWVVVLDEERRKPKGANPVGLLGEAAKVLSGDRLQWPDIYGRVGKLCKLVRDDYGYLLRLFWDASAQSPTGDFLNYVDGMIRTKKGERNGKPGGGSTGSKYKDEAARIKGRRDKQTTPS